MAEVRFAAMGSTAHVVVVGGETDQLLDVARRRIEQLESRWSRFRPTSEVSVLNARPGVPLLVSDDTYLLVERSLLAHDATGGRFDSTVYGAMVALGYDCDFRTVQSGSRGSKVDTVAVPGRAAVRVDPIVRTVWVQEGAGFDPGGIGKGLAADLVVAELLAAGASGAMVNLGGDLRAAGDAPTDAGWVVAVEAPTDREQYLANVTLRGGAICTSSRLRRRWNGIDGSELHHVVDPRSGRPVETSFVTVTVVAGEAWWAEALATAVFVASADETAALDDLLVNAHAFVVRDDGTHQTLGDCRVFAGC